MVIRVLSTTDLEAAPKLSLPTKADGSYSLTLASAPLGGTWQVLLLASGGQPQAPPVLVNTNAVDCRMDRQGVQTVYVDYRQVR